MIIDLINLKIILQVCEFINDNGGKVIRLGKNLNPLENKNIISLENENCNNLLLNLFLINSSKIFISTSSGPSSVCNLLIKTPQIQANSILESLVASKIPTCQI